MHLKRLDHSPKFWKLVAAACPKYQEARAWLRTYQKDGHAIDVGNGLQTVR
jgi:predicted metal-dependent hydrolase